MWLQAASSAASVSRELHSPPTEASGFWTWPGWTALGVLFGLIAAGAAVIAAIWSVRALGQGRAAQRIMDARYLRDIEPRLSLAAARELTFNVTSISEHRFQVDILNAGGAAISSLILGQCFDGIFVGGTAVPSHGPATTAIEFRATRSGNTYPLTPVLIAARDVQGDWWDCMVGARIQDLQSWWTSELSRLGIPPLPMSESADGLSITIGSMGGG